MDSFLKQSSFIYYTREALAEAQVPIVRLADKEGLTAHANSVKVRFPDGLVTAMELPQKLQNLTPYDPLTGHYRIRLDANESFLSPPPELMEELMAAVMAVDFNRYPDPYAAELCEKCAAFFGVDPSMVVAGNGSDELIGLIVSWFTEPDDTMAVVRPDFSMYSFYAQPCGLRLLAIDKDPDNLALDADALIARAREADARLLIFSNPCNPTSLAATRADVLKIVDGLPGCLVVVDEAYMDFAEGSILRLAGERDNLIVLKHLLQGVRHGGHPARLRRREPGPDRRRQGCEIPL